METSELQLDHTSAVDSGVEKRGEKPAATAAAVNLQATSKYLQLLSSQRGSVSEGLSQTLNSVQATLNEYVKDPSKAREASAAADESGGVYRNLSVKLVERDRNLQEKVAQDLSDASRLVRSKDAADALSTEMERLPPSLSEGTEAGKALAKTVTSSLASLSDHGSMGAGLIRDLAVRGVYVTENEESTQSRNALEKVLDLSLAYIRANSPETLAAIPEETSAKPARPGTTTPQIMTRYLRQALDEFPDENTYLDIFRKQAGKNEKTEGQDQISKETSQRIHELIAKAAATAKRGNLIPGRTEGGSAASGEQVQSESLRTQIQKSASPDSSTGSGSGRELSLSELSARASMLQRQFRMERQKLAAEGKLPNPADYPQSAADEAAGAKPATHAGSAKTTGGETTSRAQEQSVRSDVKTESAARDLTSAEVKISYKAVQSSFFGGIAAVPGMDLPVADFSSGDVKAFADAAQVSSLTSSRTMSRVLQEQQRLEQNPAPAPDDAEIPAEDQSAPAAAEPKLRTETATARQTSAPAETGTARASNTTMSSRTAAPAADDPAATAATKIATAADSPKAAAAAPLTEGAAELTDENAFLNNKNPAVTTGTEPPSTSKSANAAGIPAQTPSPAAPATAAAEPLTPAFGESEASPAAIATAATAASTDTAGTPVSAEAEETAALVAAISPATPAPESTATADATEDPASSMEQEVAAATVAASQGLSVAPAVQLSATAPAASDAQPAATENQTGNAAAFAHASRMVEEDERAQHTAAVKPQEGTAVKTAAAQTERGASVSAAAERILSATVPAEELEDADLPSDAVKNGVTANLGRAAAGDINPAAEEEEQTAAIPAVTVSKTPGAAVITTGSGAPIPDQSVVETAPAIREGGLFRKIASFFGGHGEKDQSVKPQAATLTQSMMAAAPQVKGSPLDTFFHALNVASGSKTLPPEVRAQAQKFMHALEDPVSDLASVNNWLSFVAGPMSPDSPRAAAMHGWAFFILCLRFRQLGKSVDKFLKKNGIETSIDRTLDDMLLPHQESADDIARLSSETLEQISRLQQLRGDDQAQVLPRYIPLPPSYDGGREGGLSLSSEDDPKMGKVWHLNFSFDMQGLGAVEIRAVAALPDVRISYVAEKLEGLQAIQAHREELEIELGKLGLNPSSSTPRLGHVSMANAEAKDETGAPADDGTLSLKI